MKKVNAKSKVKRMALTLLLAVLTTTTWALDQDGEGYYLISSAQDWLDFANGINDGTIAAATNVKLMADITATTMIGSFSGNFNTSKLYSGIFDGNHHTITANINNSSANYVALISCIRNATIMDLTVTGSISGGQHCSGLVSVADGTNTISNVSISATITGSNSHCAGVLGHSYSSVTTINDCIFTGTINGRSSGSTIGVFNGWSNSTGVSINNCVEAGTYTNNSNFNPIAFSGLISYSNNYFVTPAKNSNYVYGTQMSTSIPDNDVYGQLTVAGNTYYIPTVVSGIGDIYELIDDPITPEPIVTYIGNSLTKVTDYTVSYSNNDAVGTATVTITGAGEFSGEKNINFIIYSSDYALIGTAGQLKNFATLVNSGVTNAKGKLIADIDLAGDDDNQWTPIGTDANKYNGTFDGQGFTIKNLYYKQQVEGVGLFGFANSGAYIKNVRVEGTVDNSTNGAGAGNGGTQTCAGGIIGKSYGATVLNCSFSGNVISYSNVGGLVGWGTATIVNCYNEGTVMFHSTANQTGGGVHGYGGSPQLKNCYNVGSVINNGSASYAIGSLSVSGSVFNSYSRSGCVQNGSGASWINAGITGTVMSLEDMKSEAFVTTLNTNIASLRTTYPDISEWTQDPITNLPVLKIFSSLTQDENGYYLLGSVQDWKNFAELVNTTPTANAKMTADIDLGDDQTMVGTENNKYQGTFDGQGHKLTIAYNVTEDNAAPFRFVSGANIRNLHVDGTINTTQQFAGGVVARAVTSVTSISNCWSSVNIIGTYNEGSGGDTDFHGGLVAIAINASTTIDLVHLNDCLFTGSIKGGDATRSHCANFIGLQKYANSTITNCLSTATYTDQKQYNASYHWYYGGGTVSNALFLHANYTSGNGGRGTQISTEQLADGTATATLNAGRTGDDALWVQDHVTNQPMLKTFISLTHLTQDADGYYLLGSVQDWQDFATLVQTTPTANAKMTADIDLGDDQTMVGTYAVKYQGTFDGQGHTLTINYNTSSMTIESGQSYLGAAPFRDIQNATIRNLHTAGTVTADKIGATGLVGWAYGENTIERCWSSVDIVSSNNTADTFSGFVFRQDGSLLTMNDCFYSGKIQSVAKKSHAGFVGHHTAGTAILNNCLVIFAEGTDVPATTDQWTKCYTFVRDQDQGKVITLNYCYYKTAFGTVQGTQATIQQLANGTTAAALQAGRSEIVWVQDLETNQPMLKIFTLLHQDNEGYYLLGSLQNWKDFAELVQTTPGTYNARMTADIDLGDDQTMLGSFATPYAGIFDGQGHTLTIHYNTSGMTIESGQGYLGAAPFRDINGATIRNLHTAGTVTADKIGATGMVGWAYGACVIERCCVSVNITATAGDTFSGFVFRQDGTSLQINDCIFNGSIMPSEKHDHGGFVGHAYNGQTTVNNCLMLANCNFNGTSCYVFVRTVGNHNGTFTIDNSYYQTFNGTPQGTQATIQQLADGTTATDLQADRTEEIWVQDPVTNQPMLALFANTISFNGDGSEDNPFIITTTAELDYLAFLVNGVTNFYGKYFKLGNDIEYNPNVLTIDNNGDGVNDSNYTPIGNGFYIGNNGSYPFENYSFQGYFDGDGHTISGIRIYRDSITDDDKFQGIFGFLSDYSSNDSFNTSVCNLTVTDTEITGFWNIGGVIGYNNERVTIENCHVANNVVLHVIKPGSQNIGGIVGHNSGNVAHCSSAVTITVTSDASNGFNTNKFGGLVGTNTNHGILANNLVIGATIPVSNTNTAQAAGKEYGAILGWATSSFSITRHNYYSACTVAGVPNATNVGCGDSFGPHDLNDNNGAVPGYLHNVTGYGNSTESDHWALIASPVTTEGGIAPTAVGNLIADPVAEYDLYRFNQSASKEWENYKNPTHTAGFTLENGKGYLYANKNNVTLAFAGTINTDNEMTVDLAYEDGVELAGYNLVGNPFLTEAVINRNYYTMNAQGTGIVAEEVNASEPIPPFTGVIVQATGVNQSVTFTKATRQSTAPNQGNLQIAVAQANTRDNAIEDNAIVSFNEGSRLGKFYFGNPRANIYIPKSHEEYAIAYSDGHGEMPINFRANENGQYTITVNPENVEMAYLHLIDNMTGADVDLLQTPEYTFNAKVTDYESRFKLVFVAKDIDGPSTGSGTFAFIDASGNIIITADAFDASLQVIDAMGRVLVCRDARRASAISTTGMAPGVYVLRLISGDNVRTQKIVVR